MERFYSRVQFKFAQAGVPEILQQPAIHMGIQQLIDHEGRELRRKDQDLGPLRSILLGVALRSWEGAPNALPKQC